MDEFEEDGPIVSMIKSVSRDAVCKMVSLERLSQVQYLCVVYVVLAILYPNLKTKMAIGYRAGIRA